MTASVPLWRKIQRDNFTRFEPLLEFLKLNQEDEKRLLPAPRFPLNLPRRLAEKIEKGNLNDPILRQFIPLADENIREPGYTPEPVQDGLFRKTKKILHKYKGRALLLLSSACAMHCRFCFRQNFPYETETTSFEEEIRYITEETSLSEIILSGGDPLSLSDAMLGSLLKSLDAIPHLKRIRFHSRFPIGIPERIDASFLELLASCSKQMFFVIHCNHPRELDSDIFAALKKIQRLGIPVLNQAVLLRGVNDNPQTLLDLSNALINGGILPYYLHELDLVEGASHFASEPNQGANLIRFIRENLSGFGVPHLVREIPGYPSKTFINT